MSPSGQRSSAATAVLVVAGHLALAGLAPAVAGAAERRLTLEEALASALQRNQAILLEREALTASEAATRGALGPYDPLLELDTGWRRSSAPTNSAFSGAPDGVASPTGESAEARVSIRQLLATGGRLSLRANAARETTDAGFALLSPAYGSSVGLELRQPLLRGLATDSARLRVKAAGADHRGARAVLRGTVIETVAAVERTYWALVAARRAVEVHEDAVRLAEEQLEQTSIRISSGVAPETELAQPRAELERRRGDLLAGREVVARTESALKLLILGDGDDAAWIERLTPVDDARVEVERVDVALALEQALGSRPELEAAAAVIERRQAETAFAREIAKPVIDAVASYDRFSLAGAPNPAWTSVPGLEIGVPDGMEGGWRRSFAMLGDGDFDDARVGLVLGLPIGNREARAAAAVARSAERQAQTQRERARNLVRADVLDAVASVETAGGRIEATRAARQAAEVQLAAERERYAVGLSTNFLVLTRQNDLARARLDEISALTDYRTARAELSRATGTLLEERHIAVNDPARSKAMDRN